MAVNKEVLSGSTDGNPIKVGAIIHTGPTPTTTEYDEVWLWVHNTSNAATDLTIEWGGTTDPDNLIQKEVSIPAQDVALLVVPGWVVRGAASAKEIRAFAGTTNVLLITGYVNAIT